MSRKSRGESVTWLSRLVTPAINTAKQEQGLERTPTCSTPAPHRTAAKESKERPKSVHLPSIPAGLTAVSTTPAGQLWLAAARRTSVGGGVRPGVAPAAVTDLGEIEQMPTPRFVSHLQSLQT